MNRQILLIIYIMLLPLILIGQEKPTLTKIITIKGDSDKPYFGSFVNNIGDINNDGFEDMAIVDYRSPEPIPNWSYFSDRVYIYYGGIPFDTIPDISFRLKEYPIGMRPYGNMDINGDGFTDLAIVSSGYNVNQGRINIHFGDVNGLDTIPDIKIYGEAPNTHFGKNMVSGDVNNDGYDDILVSAPHDFYADYGAAYLYLGGKDFDNKVDWSYRPFKEWSNYGNQIEIGDINNDGYDDFFVLTAFIDHDSDSLDSELYFYFGQDNIDMDYSHDYLYKTQNLTHITNIKFLPEYNENGSVLIANFGDYVDYKKFLIFTYDDDKIQCDTLLVGYPDQTYYPGGYISGYFNNDNYIDLLYTSTYSTGNNFIRKNIFTGPNCLKNQDTLSIFSKYYNRYERYSSVCSIDIDSDSIDEIIIRCSELDSNLNKNYSVLIYGFDSLSVNLSSIDEGKNNISNKFKLHSNYPNPFNATTNIKFEIYDPTFINIDMINIRGEKVDNIANQKYDRGTYTIWWDANRFPSGVYIIQISSDNNQIIKSQKCCLLK